MAILWVVTVKVSDIFMTSKVCRSIVLPHVGRYLFNGCSIDQHFNKITLSIRFLTVLKHDKWIKN